MNRQKEQLHQLRVELKKWRAGLRFLRSADPAFPYAEMYEPFKTIFAAAGRLRFWQLQRLFANRATHTQPDFARFYRKYARRCIKEARIDFNKMASREMMPGWRELKQEFRQSFKACTPKAVQTYFDGMQKDILEKTSDLSRRRTAGLHDLRKLLKEYANNRQLTVKHLRFDPGLPAGIPGDTNFDERLGQWHDLDAACAQLAADLRAQGWEEEMLCAGKAVLREWRRAERQMWTEIAEALRKP